VGIELWQKGFADTLIAKGSVSNLSHLEHMRTDHRWVELFFKQKTGEELSAGLIQERCRTQALQHCPILVRTPTTCNSCSYPTHKPFSTVQSLSYPHDLQFLFVPHDRCRTPICRTPLVLFSYFDDSRALLKVRAEARSSSSMINETTNESGLLKMHWAFDGTATTCRMPGCSVPFDLFNRRHHCRM
jgi:hypothetical protein